jgi:DNA transformation protein and related proteins
VVSTKPETVTRIVQLLATLDIRSRPMFGEYTLYVGDKVVGVVADDHLFIKITRYGQGKLGSENEASAYPGAKPSFLIPSDKVDDAEWLTDLVRHTAEELPAPKPKKGSSRS